MPLKAHLTYVVTNPFVDYLLEAHFFYLCYFVILFKFLTIPTNFFYSSFNLSYNLSFFFLNKTIKLSRNFDFKIFYIVSQPFT